MILKLGEVVLTVTKIFEFAYAHYLPEYPGKCKVMHGHTGILEVEVIDAGGVKAFYPGMIIDFGDLKKVVNQMVIDRLDHAMLNHFIEIPTAENITKWVVEQLTPAFGQGLQRVRVYETPTSYAEWRRNEDL